MRRMLRAGFGSLLVAGLLAVAVLAVAVWAGAAWADTASDRRVALVIGNSRYQHVPALDNPKNDARLIAQTLIALGFKLIGNGPQIDLNRVDFERVIRTFGREIGGADVALFYYAGHGLQVQGANWLVPVTANPESVADLDFEMIDADLVMKQMHAAGAHLNLIILDACRVNPFGGRGLRDAGGGLAQMRAPEGTMVSYATQPGNVARDGSDGDSPYSKALAASMRKPGLGIFQVFNEVGLEVKRVTGGDQEPWLSSSPIEGDFQFARLTPSAVTPTPSPAAPPPAAVAPAPAPVVDEGTLFWESIKDSKNAADFEAYLKQYPTGPFAPLARNQLLALQPPAPPPPPAPVQAPPPSLFRQPTTGDSNSQAGCSRTAHTGAAFDEGGVMGKPCN
jgi:uncharacterized caspase-like protein